MHLTAEVESSGWHNVQLRLADDTELIIQHAVEKATKAAETKAKEGRFQDRTGLLRSEITHRIEGWTGKWFWGFCESPTKYAKYVEFPTKAHEIWPKAAFGTPKSQLKPGQSKRGTGKGPHEYVVGRGYALRWVDGGGEHFARYVNHPGTEGKKFMWAASVAAMTVLRTEIRNGFVGLATVH